MARVYRKECLKRKLFRCTIDTKYQRTDTTEVSPSRSIATKYEQSFVTAHVVSRTKIAADTNACFPQIVDMVNNNNVVVIEGSTGSGKTTQVPQYILAHHASRRQYCNIIVTQPRRIAAMSVAARVCHELNCRPSTLCGHKVRTTCRWQHSHRYLHVHDIVNHVNSLHF